MADKTQKTPKSHEDLVQKRKQMRDLKKAARANERAARRPLRPQKH